jgi:hypothetical protein
LLSGGHAYSESALRKFRSNHREFMRRAVIDTVRIANEMGLIDPRDLALDSMRLRADVSTKSLRTLARSRKRLGELAKVDLARLDEAGQRKHAAQVQKHQEAVARCEAEGVASFRTTSDLAALMKFPNGAAQPGHRVTAAVAGVSQRIIVGVLVGKEPTDLGLLGAGVQEALSCLEAAGVELGSAGAGRPQIAADAGYVAKPDLVFAEQRRSEVDLLVSLPAKAAPVDHEGGEKLFGREHFHVTADQHVLCPAGKQMTPCTQGKQEPDRRRYRATGCPSCPLKPQCTTSPHRRFTIDYDYEQARAAMAERMAQPDATGRYRRRIATAEPPFAALEEDLGYRRASSRHPRTVVAEVLLKVLAHNLSRLIRAGLLRVIYCHLESKPHAVSLLRLYRRPP